MSAENLVEGGFDERKTKINLETFQKLFNLYYVPLCNFLNLYTRNSQTIEDIVQEVFVNLWENRDTFEINNAKAYLFKAAKNKITNYLRDEETRHTLIEKWYEQQLRNTDAKDSFNTERLIAQVKEAVETLPPKCKDFFILSKKQNLTYKQIAEYRNVSVKTVENQIGIALKKIREYLFSHY